MPTFTYGVEVGDYVQLDSGTYYNENTLSSFQAVQPKGTVTYVNGPVSTVKFDSGEVVKIATVTLMSKAV